MHKKKMRTLNNNNNNGTKKIKNPHSGSETLWPVGRDERLQGDFEGSCQSESL